MTLTGQHTVNASAQTIWNMMMDPDTLARITPGITKLERIDEENFNAIAELKVGPVGGAFTGNLKVVDRVEPKSFRLVVQQNSKIGNANAEISIKLDELEPGKTEVSFTGEVKLSGMLAAMGQRVLSPMANMLSGQFFDALQKEVQSA